MRAAKLTQKPVFPLILLLFESLQERCIRSYHLILKCNEQNMQSGFHSIDNEHIDEYALVIFSIFLMTTSMLVNKVGLYVSYFEVLKKKD